MIDVVDAAPDEALLHLVPFVQVDVLPAHRNDLAPIFGAIA